MTVAATTLDIPAHVPRELVWDVDLETFLAEGDDPFVAASRMHQGPDIIWATRLPHGRSGWVITRHALQQEAFIDHERFTSEGGSGIAAILGEPLALIPLEIDPPQHTAYRKILNPLFTPVAVKALEAPVRATCDDLIAQFVDRGSCEFISEFAIPFPSHIFLSVAGLPKAMLANFLKWEEDLHRSHDGAVRAAAGRNILHYLRDFVKSQREAPGSDLFKALFSGEIDGRPLTDLEILGTIFTFYVGGLDTVYSTLGWTMRHIAMDQQLQQKLRDNLDKLPQAVDEFARAYSIVSTMRRVKHDMTFHGVPMKAGDVVLFPLYLAGRDEREFANPHQIDIDRRASALTFASGAHLCLGRQLARRELRIALEAFLTRFDNIHIPEGETCTYHAGVTFGVDRLPLAWTRRN